MPFISGLGPSELIIILVIALIVVGPGRLPDVGAGLGKSIREFRKAVTEVKDVTSLDPGKADAAAPVRVPAAASAALPAAATPAAATPAAPAASSRLPALAAPEAPVPASTSPAPPVPIVPGLATAGSSVDSAPVDDVMVVRTAVASTVGWPGLG